VTRAVAVAARRSTWLRHFTDDEYTPLVVPVDNGRHESSRTRRQARREFVRQWPELGAWMAAPVTDRLMHAPPYATARHRHVVVRGHRLYVSLLAMHGRIALDYPWLFANSFKDLLTESGKLLGLGPEWLTPLDIEAARIGYRQPAAHRTIAGACVRIALHRGTPDWRTITVDDLDHFRADLDAFVARDDVKSLRPEFVAGGSVRDWYRNLRTSIYTTQVVLHSLGVVAEQVRYVSMGPRAHQRSAGPPAIEKVINRYIELTAPARTHRNVRNRFRIFTSWLAEHHPEVTSLAELARAQLEEFLTWVTTGYRNCRTGQLVSVSTQAHIISMLNVFLRKTLAWKWDDVPNRPLLSHLDMPKQVKTVPRYLPAPELDAVVEGIRALTDPYQRAACLIARWVGPRRSEILRLELDCLDTYPDGHPRLRIPAGKTYTERMVPLHAEAADALRACIEHTRARRQRPLIDEVTGKPTTYVFQLRGRLLSHYFLFDSALQQACEHAGLIDVEGAKTVTSHRFRHTVGTQLAEEGARIQTIMAILGHASPAMSLFYARISDTAVLNDYQAALRPGALLAGPAAEAIRNNELSQQTVNWLSTNYYKTALELGHCLRLPEEGPCECDLFLTCSKFVTTTDYTPRLRERLCLEQRLAEDAAQHGWPREAERHNAIVGRIAALLEDLAAHEPTAIDK
jgi:integrase